MIKIRYLLLISLILCLNGMTVLYLKNKTSQILVTSFDEIHESGSLEKTNLENQFHDEYYVNEYEGENVKFKSNILSDSPNLTVQNDKQRRHYRRQMLDIQELRVPKQLSKSKFQDIMKKRIQNIHEVCQRMKLSEAYSSVPTRLFILKENNILYCPVFKAASSTWINIMLELADNEISKKPLVQKSPTKDLIERAKIAGIYDDFFTLDSMSSEEQYQSKLSGFPNKNTTAFLVVRHPFERLVSAFRDKLERSHPNNNFYFEMYGETIVQQFRKEAIDLFGKDFFNSSNNFGALLPVPDNRRPNAKFPSFWEFVQYLLRPEIPMGMDEHWVPTYYHCSICEKSHLAVLTHVLKFEHLETENSAFLNYGLNMGSFRDIRYTNGNRPEGISSSEITQLYFSTLSNADINGLYKLYQPDFMLFDYNFKYGNIEIPSGQTSRLRV